MEVNSGSTDVKGHSGMAAVMTRLLSESSDHQKQPDISDRSTTSQDNSLLSGQDSNTTNGVAGRKRHTDDRNDSLDERSNAVKRKRLRNKGTGVSLSDVVKKYHQLPQDMNFEVERELQRIATRGVVQLFNAVGRQQKEIESKLKQAESSEGKQAKVMATSIDKGSFIDMLKSGSGLQQSARKNKSKTSTQPTQPNWPVLRDDYMKKSKLKSWDSIQEDELGNTAKLDTNDDPSISDSSSSE